MTLIVIDYLKCEIYKMNTQLDGVRVLSHCKVVSFLGYFSRVREGVSHITGGTRLRWCACCAKRVIKCYIERYTGTLDSIPL